MRYEQVQTFNNMWTCSNNHSGQGSCFSFHEIKSLRIQNRSHPHWVSFRNLYWPDLGYTVSVAEKWKSALGKLSIFHIVWSSSPPWTLGRTLHYGPCGLVFFLEGRCLTISYVTIDRFRLSLPWVNFGNLYFFRKPFSWSRFSNSLE